MINNNTVMDEFFKVWAEPVMSEFELQIKKEIDAWIKKQPAEKSWATPQDAVKDYWSERLA